MEKLLDIKDVTLTYQTKSGEVTAIKDLTFSVSRGEFAVIIGRSGCGKTSILSIIAGLLKCEGEVKLCGENIVKPNRNIGYMLQKDELFPWLTIEQNAMLPLDIKKIRTKENTEYVRS